MNELALTESPSLRAHYADLIRKNGERYVYVVEFSSGTVKVGQTRNAKTRLADYVKTAKAHCDNVTRTWISEPHTGFAANEEALISFCGERWSPAAGREYFSGANFDQVVEYAQGLRYQRLDEAAIEAEVQKLYGFDQERREARARAVEVAHLNEAADRLNQLHDQVRMIAPLINDENRWAANDTIFELVREMVNLLPAPWNEDDPTAMERYLIAYGATATRAQSAAPAIEIDMRALYAMAHGKHASSFDDLARFCAPYMRERES